MMCQGLEDKMLDRLPCRRVCWMRGKRRTRKPLFDGLQCGELVHRYHPSIYPSITEESTRTSESNTHNRVNGARNRVLRFNPLAHRNNPHPLAQALAQLRPEYLPRLGSQPFLSMSRILSPQFIDRKFRRSLSRLQFQLFVFLSLNGSCRAVESCRGGGMIARNLPARCAHHPAHVAAACDMGPAIVVCDLEAFLCGD